MFLTLQHRWRRPRMRENVRRTVESLCREFVTFDIAPPREQKLLKYSEKRVKWGLGIFGWGLLRQRPPFICPGYSSSMRVTAPPVASSMRRARSGEGRRSRHASRLI
jgi:hypothetical protein